VLLLSIEDASANNHTINTVKFDSASYQLYTPHRF
jgi:hypothetical protein